MRHVLPILCAAALFVAGCSDPVTPKSAEDAGRTNSQQKGEQKEKTASLSGTWLLVISRMDSPRESQIAVIKVGREMGGDYFGKVLDSSDDVFPEATLEKTVVSDKRIQLEFRVGSEGKLTVRGSLDGDTIYGNARTGSGLQPIRLVRTDETTLEGSRAIPTEGAEAFEAARDSDDSVDRLKQFAEKFNTSPTALSAYITLLVNSKQQELDEAAVSQIIEDFIKTGRRWGPQMENNVRLDSAAILVQQEYLPDLAVKTLLPLETETDDEDDSGFTERLKLAMAMARVISADKETRKVGATMLQELHEEKPLDHRLRVALAKHHDKNGDKSTALRLFAELAVLPDGDAYLRALSRQGEEEPESADRASSRLWKSINGEADGLDEYRDQVYESVMHRAFGSQSASPPTETAGTRVSLCELFTGSACPPCVAADMATAGLEATYPSSRLIVLRYHQHIPLPDPLTNADAETRFAYYEPEGTPTVILNGRQVRGIAGPFVYSQLMYAALREKVERVIDSDSKLSIQLSANAAGGTLALNVKVDGATELPPTARLRLVLAEEVVRFDARNGIRRHEMIVRYMPGGPDGIAVEEGRLSFQSSLKLASIKQGLVDYLDKISKQFDQPLGLPPQLRQQMPNGPFPVRPLELKPLRLVAFVQDDASQEVLQAAAIPVSGKLEYPAEPAEPNDPPAPAENDADRPVKAPVPGSVEPPPDRPAAPKPGGSKSTARPKSGPKLISPNSGTP